MKEIERICLNLIVKSKVINGIGNWKKSINFANNKIMGYYFFINDTLFVKY